MVVGGSGLVCQTNFRSSAECRKQDPQTVAGGAGGAGGDGGRGRGFNFQSGSLAGATGSGGSPFGGCGGFVGTITKVVKVVQEKQVELVVSGVQVVVTHQIQEMVVIQLIITPSGFTVNRSSKL